MGVRQVYLQNVRSIGEARLEIGAFTVLVGPNGSGKTTLLRAVQRAAQAHGAVAQGDGRFSFRIQESDADIRVEVDSPERPLTSYLRADPGVLEEASALPRAEELLTARGQRLAGAVTRLILERPDLMARIDADLTSVVPSFRKVRSRPVNATEFELRFDFAAANDIAQAEVSSGTLAALATLVLVHAQGNLVAMGSGSGHPMVALIDDPETGLHPGAQLELALKLMAVAEGGTAQILVATHSPYIVDAAGASNVWVLGGNAEGRSEARRLSDHPDAQRSLEVLTAGEFWGAVGEDWVGAAS